MTAPTKPRLIGVRIDIESKSSTEIKYGSYRYCEDPDFEALIIAYSPMRKYPGGTVKLGKPRVLDNGPCGDLAEEAQFKQIIQNPRFQKHAFNANFERIALSKWLGMPNGTYLDPENWNCTAIQANVNGVFGTLEEVGRALRSPASKDREGKRLIRLFSVPDKKQGGRFHQPTGCWCGADHWADWRAFIDYCRQDVVTEAMVARLLPPIPADIQAQYEADQRINDRGVRHFSGLSKAAVAQVKIERDRLMSDLAQMTGLENPNSGKQFGEWLESMDYPMVSLDKDHREEALADPMIPDEVRDALILKGQASLSSVTKHQAMLDTRCIDGRIRGSLQFYGAHTGREAGRGFQPQNLPRYEAPAEHRVALVRGTITSLPGVSVAEAAKGTVRAALVPAPGHVFIAPDYNAIEARTLGWVTGEKWVEAEFDPAQGGQGKIYEATAAMMFGVDKAKLLAELSTCGKCGKLTCNACLTRGKGKVSNLALGYAGGAGALVTMGAEEAGIDIGNYNELHALWKAAETGARFHEWERDLHDYPELIRLRDLYREASPMTVRFWKLCAKAWDLSCQGQGARFGQNQVVAMVRDGKHNRLVLPSGRSIWYRYARAHPDPNRPERIDRRTFIGKGKGVGHMRTDTHGGKMCIEGSALVLTDRGWVPLRDVCTSDRVWDGVMFVAQDGLVSKGARPVINVEGVKMTPDHRIMQRGEWREAQQYDRSDWSIVGLPDSAPLWAMGTKVGRRWLTPDVVDSVPVRSRVRDAERRSATRPARSEGASEVLRVHASGDGAVGPTDGRRRTQQAPALQPLAYGEVQVHEADSPRMGKLRWAWDHHVRPLAARLLGVRRGHGTDMAAGADSGTSGQQRALRTGQLPVGDDEGAGEQPTPTETAEVFDLMNCGPRNRFTILTERGPLLVHNCENINQAIARDVLFDLIMKIEALTAQGWPGRIVLHVHDELVLEVPKQHADQVLADTLGLMSVPPVWAPGLAVQGAGSIMERYGK